MNEFGRLVIKDDRSWSTYALGILQYTHVGVLVISYLCWCAEVIGSEQILKSTFVAIGRIPESEGNLCLCMLTQRCATITALTLDQLL